MRLVYMFVVVLVVVHCQQYKKHIKPINYDVPHEVIFRGERCWNGEEADLLVPSNCTSNYCSKCFFNSELRDYRNHYMSYNDNRLIVASLDLLLAFDVTDNLFEKLEQVDMSASVVDASARPECLGNWDKSDESCRNYNRVLLPLPEMSSVLTCGTTAYRSSRACQIRPIKDLSSFEPLKADGFSPVNEDVQNTAMFSDSRIFAATMISGSPTNNLFAISSAKIGMKEDSRKAFVNVVSTTASADWLNRAKFVASFSSGSYAYFLFQEIDEMITPGRKQVVSRIARVCKEDVGLQETTSIGVENARLWQTFVKARIYCENRLVDRTFGDQVFTYNRVGDGVIDENRVLYAAFSEGDTSASGSVVCRFSLDDIDANFDTGFYVGPNQGQLQRTPPTCEAIGDLDSRDIYDLRLTQSGVTSKEAPLFLMSGPRFTKLLLDSSIRNSSTPVIFIGTNMGKVLKVTWTVDKEGNNQPVLIESLQVAVGDLDSDLTVNFLAFEKTLDPNYLFVGSGTSVSKVVISRCLRFPALSKVCCYASRDPYCGWCATLNKCTSRSDCSSEWVQSLTAPLLDDSCEAKDPGVSADEEAVRSETRSWKTVAIVMAILCGIFVLISALLALNLARMWCVGGRKPPLKSAQHNMQHNYNPLSGTGGPKSDDFSDRIPVYNTRTNNV